MQVSNNIARIDLATTQALTQNILLQLVLQANYLSTYFSSGLQKENRRVTPPSIFSNKV